mgnify:CR=1 FL=1
MRPLGTFILLCVISCSSDGSRGRLNVSDVSSGTARDAVDGADSSAGVDGGDQIDAADGSDGADNGDATTSLDSADTADATDGGVASDGLDGSSSPSGIVVEDLGTIQATGGTSGTLSFTTPENAVSFSITVEGEDGVFYAVDNLRGPDGVVLAPGSWPTNIANQGGHIVCLICDNRLSSGESAHGVLVPNTPNVSMLPGTWTFSVMSFTVSAGGNAFGAPTVELTDSSYDVRVSFLEPEADVIPTAGVLGLNLWFTGSNGLSAESAQTDERLQAAVLRFIETYASAGIAVSPVRYFDLDIGIDTVDSLSGAGNDFEALASATAGADAGVNLIFVEEIVDGSSPLSGFGLILGIAGGIPGPTLGQGTGRSAVLIRTADVPEGAGLEIPANLGNTMAHEAGHYLGLFHSSEQALFGPQLHDPIPDTAENDNQNLMHFNNLGNTISEQQGAVLRSNPWVAPEGE